MENPKIRFKGFTKDWEQRKLGDDLVSIHTGTNLLGSITNTGMPLIKMGNIQRGYFDTSKVEFLAENEQPDKADIVNYGDFFFNTRNTLELVGKGATWMKNSGEYAFNSNIARFELRNLDTIFFNYLYNTDYMTKQIHARAMGTTSVAAIYPRTLDSVEYLAPCMKEQQKIGAYFKQLDHLITLHQRKCDELKKMKKLVTLLLSLALVLSLAACGGEATPDASDDAPASSQNEESTENDNTENQIVFEEVVAIDNAECAVKITEIDPDNMWGYTLKAQLENKSTEKTYMFSVESASINGVQCDPMFASEVAAGKKANEEINFSTDTLEENGIVEYTDIELTFKVYDSNDWSADPVGKETIHVYPYGEENAVAFVREAQATDNVIIDNDYVTVIVTGYEDDEIWGYTANLFLLNKTDKTVMFSVDDASVNGFMADPFYATSVSAGKCAFSSMAWSDTTLEENGITEVEEIEVLFRAYDADDFMGEDFANEVITLNP